MIAVYSFFKAVHEVVSDSFKLRNQLLKQYRYNVSE